MYSEVHLTSISRGRYLVGRNSENIFREIQKKQLEFEDFMLAKKLSSDVSLEHVEVEDIVDRKVDQLSHQYLYQVKLKGEIDLVWLNAHNFLELVKYNKRRSQDILPRKPQFAQKPEKEIKRKRKVEGGQSTIPTKIRKKSVNVIQSYTVLDQILSSSVKNLVYTRSLDLNSNPPGMRRHSDVSFMSHISRDVVDHAKTSL